MTRTPRERLPKSPSRYREAGSGEETELMLPEARQDGLVIEELLEEILVYDLKRHRAYCLNRTAALAHLQHHRASDLSANGH